MRTHLCAKRISKRQSASEHQRVARGADRFFVIIGSPTHFAKAETAIEFARGPVLDRNFEKHFEHAAFVRAQTGRADQRRAKPEAAHRGKHADRQYLGFAGGGARHHKPGGRVIRGGDESDGSGMGENAAEKILVPDLRKTLRVERRNRWNLGQIGLADAHGAAVGKRASGGRR